MFLWVLMEKNWFFHHTDICRSRQLFWFDFRKVLREHKSGQGVLGRDRLLAGSCLNPDSWFVRGWNQCLSLLALYHFLVVPVCADSNLSCFEHQKLCCSRAWLMPLWSFSRCACRFCHGGRCLIFERWRLMDWQTPLLSLMCCSLPILRIEIQRVCW